MIFDIPKALSTIIAVKLLAFIESSSEILQRGCYQRGLIVENQMDYLGETEGYITHSQHRRGQAVV